MIGLAALCFAGGLAAALLVLLVARAMGWRRRSIGMAVRPILLVAWIMLTIGLSDALADGLSGMDDLAWTLLGGWLAIGALLHFVDRGRSRPSSSTRLWGARIAHLGFAIAAGGMVLSSAFASTARHDMEPGGTIKFVTWTIQLHEVWPAAGEEWAGVAAELRASSGDGVVLLEPELRSVRNRLVEPRSATVASGSGRLSATLGPRDRDGAWPIRFSWTPMLALIPLGGWVAALGGILALVGQPVVRWRRLRRARLANAWWA